MNTSICHEMHKDIDYGDTRIVSRNYTDSLNIWKELEPKDYIKIFALSVLIVGGLLGNISVILTVILNKSMRTTINFYVANLAVADAMICIICMTLHALEVAMTKQAYVFGSFLCKFNHFTAFTCLISSVLTLCAISLDRFLVVVFSTRMIGVKQRTSLVISAIWMISAAISLPLLFFKKLAYDQYINHLQSHCAEIWPTSWYYNEEKGECVWYTPLRIVYYIVICTTLYFLPLIIMISAYSLIAWTVRTRPGVQQTCPGQQSETIEMLHSRTRKKVNQMVLFVLITFFVCWTPFQVLVMYSAFYKPGTTLPYGIKDMKWASYYLAYANSFINPIIYGGFNKSFRDGFCDILRCGCPRGRLGKLALSIQTFTTRLTSSRKRTTPKIPNGDKNNSPRYNVEMQVIQPVENEEVAATARDTCVAVVGTRNKDNV